MTGPDGREPSNWELMRVLERIQKSLESVVTQQVFTAWQEGNERRHTQNERALAEWVTESKGAHVELAAEIKAERVAREAIEAEQRRTRSQRTFTVAMTISGWIVALVTSLWIASLR